MKADKARLFFALDPPAEVRQQIIVQRSLLPWSGRAAPDSNLHITLLYLGSVAFPRLPEIHQLAESLPFPDTCLVLDRAGCFSRAHIGWLGCSRIPQVLSTFRQALFEAADSRHVHRDKRPWVPHVTLYRDLRTPSGNISIEPIEWRLRNFFLMQSLQSKKGLVYKPLGCWPGV
jgi:2'-5' RNA ligase